MDERYELWSRCFGDTPEYMDYYWNWKMKKNRVLEEYRDGKLVSMLHRNPYEVSLCGHTQTADYIVGVATHPDYRHQGLMAGLLRRSLNEMYQEGRIFTYLMPAAKEIYLPFDFRYVYSQQRGEISGEVQKELISCNAGKKVELSEWCGLTEAEKTEACLWSNEFLGGKTELAALRDRDYYDDAEAERKAAGGMLLFARSEGRIAGLLSYMTEEGVCTVTECMAEEKDSRALFAAFLEWTAGTFQQLKVLDMRWTGIREGWQEQPAIMARLVNPQAFAACCRTKETGSMTLYLEDPLIRENNDYFCLTWGPEGCRMERCGQTENACRMSAGDLTEQLFRLAVPEICLNEIV